MSPLVDASDVRRCVDARNSHDLDRISGLFAEDAVVYLPGRSQRLTVPDLLEAFAMLFEACPNVGFVLEGVTVQGREAASWERVAGTMTGVFQKATTGHEIAPTGRRFDLSGAMRLAYDDVGLITKATIYWDRMAFWDQLGLPGDPELAPGTVESMLERWTAAHEQGQMDVVRALAWPGYTAVGHAGQLVDLEQYIRVHAVPFDRFVVKPERVRQDGAVATVVGETDLARGHVATRSRFLATLLHKHGVWRIHTWQETPFPQD